MVQDVLAEPDGAGRAHRRGQARADASVLEPHPAVRRGEAELPLRRNTDGLGRPDVERHLIQAIRESGPPYAELLARKRDAAALLGELAQYDGILVPSGTETADDPPSYLFLHRTFHEYLGARHLAHLPDDQWQAVIEEHLWFDPDWEQVILLLTAQLPQPETLLQLLLDQPHDPFHYALRMAGLAL